MIVVVGTLRLHLGLAMNMTARIGFGRLTHVLKINDLSGGPQQNWVRFMPAEL